MYVIMDKKNLYIEVVFMIFIQLFSYFVFCFEISRIKFEYFIFCRN